MDSNQFNKFAMAGLGTVFVLFGASILTEAIFEPEAPENPGYIIAAAEPTDTKTEAASGPEYAPVVPLLASADAAAGEAVFKKCASCHNAEKGGPNKVGPNLYGVVGRPIASHEGFSYSAAMKAFGEGKTWTFEELNGFLWNPKKHVPGTAMGFAGLKNVADRANILVWLNSTHSDSPLPITAEAAPAATEAAPAATEAAPAATEAAPAADTPAATAAPATETPAQPAAETPAQPAAQ